MKLTFPLRFSLVPTGPPKPYYEILRYILLDLYGEEGTLHVLRSFFITSLEVNGDFSSMQEADEVLSQYFTRNSLYNGLREFLYLYPLYAGRDHPYRAGLRQFSDLYTEDPGLLLNILEHIKEIQNEVIQSTNERKVLVRKAIPWPKGGCPLYPAACLKDYTSAEALRDRQSKYGILESEQSGRIFLAPLKEADIDHNFPRAVQFYKSQLRK